MSTKDLKEMMKPSALLYEIRKSVSEILNVIFTEKIDHQVFRRDQRTLALWARDCAEHVLPCFEEKKYPYDDRPRKVNLVLGDWIGTGVFKMNVISGTALAAHAGIFVAKRNNHFKNAVRLPYFVPWGQFSSQFEDSAYS